MTRWGHHGCPDRFTALPRESDALHAISHNKAGPRRPKARAIFLCDLPRQSPGELGWGIPALHATPLWSFDKVQRRPPPVT